MGHPYPLENWVRRYWHRPAIETASTELHSGARVVIQWVKYLLHRLKELSLNLQNTPKSRTHSVSINSACLQEVGRCRQESSRSSPTNQHRVSRPLQHRGLMEVRLHESISIPVKRMGDTVCLLFLASKGTECQCYNTLPLESHHKLICILKTGTYLCFLWKSTKEFVAQF